MSEAISTNSGEQLWQVKIEGSYWDEGSRGSHDIPLIAKAYVVAKTEADAIVKAEVLECFISVRSHNDDPANIKVGAKVLTVGDIQLSMADVPELEPGWHLNDKPETVMLTDANDGRRFRLLPCLVPVED